MRHLFGLTAVALSCFAGSQTAQAQYARVDLVVARGKSVMIRQMYQYQGERGCTALPAAPIDTNPKPRLGTVESVSVKVLGNGPCGRQEYPGQRIIYKAGNTPGVDEFRVYIFSTAFWGGSPFDVPVRIVVK